MSETTPNQQRCARKQTVNGHHAKSRGESPAVVHTAVLSHMTKKGV